MFYSGDSRDRRRLPCWGAADRMAPDSWASLPSPRTALTRTVLAEVLATSKKDPASYGHGVNLKVWLGILQQALEEFVDFAVDGVLEPDVPFLGFGSRFQQRRHRLVALRAGKSLGKLTRLESPAGASGWGSSLCGRGPGRVQEEWERLHLEGRPSWQAWTRPWWMRQARQGQGFPTVTKGTAQLRNGIWASNLTSLSRS